MSAYLPPEADEWDDGAQRFALSEANRVVDLRREIDAIIGDEDPNWTTTGRSPGSFTRDELALMLGSLRGAQEGGGRRPEAKRYVLSKTSRVDNLREEIDAVIGNEEPAWTTTGREPASFSKKELALVLLALGGPREGDG